MSRDMEGDMIDITGLDEGLGDVFKRTLDAQLQTCRDERAELLRVQEELVRALRGWVNEAELAIQDAESYGWIDRGPNTFKNLSMRHQRTLALLQKLAPQKASHDSIGPRLGLEPLKPETGHSGAI